MNMKKRSTRRRVRKCGVDDVYLQRDDTWGDYQTARIFPNDEAAEKHCERLGLGNNYGTFPVGR